MANCTNLSFNLFNLYIRLLIKNDKIYSIHKSMRPDESVMYTIDLKPHLYFIYLWENNIWMPPTKRIC